MKTKKIISLLISIAIIFSISTLPVVHASEISTYEVGNTVFAGNIAVYYFQNPSYFYCIYLNTITRQASFAIAYSNYQDSVYEYNLTIDPEDLDANSIEFWQEIVSYCIKRSDSWSEIYLPDAVIITESPSNNLMSTTTSSVETGFKEELTKIFGTEEYIGKALATSYHNGTVFQVYEDMEYYVSEKAVFYIPKALSVAAFITGVLKKPVASGILTALSFFADAIIPEKTEIGSHYVGVMWSRYVKRLDSSVWLTNCMYSQTYDGYAVEVNDDYGVDIDSMSVSYSPSQKYFEDLYGQLNEGIAYYLTLP